MATNEYDIAQGNIKRRRGLVDALTEQSLTPSKGGMVGQVYVGPGLLDALSKPLLALAGTYAGQGLDKEELANSQARQSGLVNALAGLQHQPGTPGFTAEALGSQFPELQTAGMANLQAQLSPRAQETYGPPITVNGPNGPQLIQPSNRGNSKILQGVTPYQKPEGQLKIIDNGDGTQSYAAIDPNTGAAKPIEGVNAYVRPPAQTNINNNMPKQEGAFGRKLGEKDAERYDAANTAIQNEQQMLSTVQKFKEFENKDVFRGGLSGIAVKAAQIGSSLGMQVPENISNAEQLNGLVQSMVVDFIKQGGRGITDEEGARLVQMVPAATASPEGARKLREQMESTSQQAIKRAKVVQGTIRQRYPDAFQKPESSTLDQSAGGIKFLGFE